VVDFWTYTCINCQRALPHVEAWYSRYAKDGLVVVGVETPEFAFEHVVSNVAAAAGQLGVHYPIAVDDDYGTWNAYNNEYWPADYLIDARGDVRHVSFGEGAYGQTEGFIRQLLMQAHPGVALPPPTSVPDMTPTEASNPETYVGYERAEYLVNGNVTPNRASQYSFPAEINTGQLALGGTWTEEAEDAVAGPGAQMELGFEAEHVYLVLEGTGTVTVSVGGRRSSVVRVSGEPTLYTLFNSPSGIDYSGTLTLAFSPGLAAYDFTFG
jgi:thiol-disulfide isomerase/thioredoxin